MSLHVGRFNTLTVQRLTRPGAFLSNGVDEVLLPYRHVPAGLKVGDTLEAFVYCDSEDRLVATTQKPLAQVGQFAAMTVRSVTSFGAFLDWGLDKDLLLPFAEQGRRVREGQRVPVFVYYDEISRRLAASTKLNRYTARHPDRLDDPAIRRLIGRINADPDSPDRPARLAELELKLRRYVYDRLTAQSGAPMLEEK